MISSAIFLLVFVLGLFVHQIVYFVVFPAFMILSLWEFFGMTKKKSAKPQLIYAIVFSLIIFAATYLYTQKLLPLEIIFTIPALVFPVFAMELFRKSKPFENLAYTFLGIIYIGIPFSLFNIAVFPQATDNKFTFRFIAGFFMLIWAFDIGAYLVGSLIGRTPFFKRISPKKTWEGTIGGGLISMATAVLVFYLYRSMTLVDWLTLSVIISVTAVLGDLVESMLKRDINIKDSGKIMPGHGGVLDRFDSSLFSIPFFVGYLILRNLELGIWN